MASACGRRAVVFSDLKLFSEFRMSRFWMVSGVLFARRAMVFPGSEGSGARARGRLSPLVKNSP